MSLPFADLAANVRKLEAGIRALDAAAEPLALEPTRQREWFQLLEQKLRPQLSEQAFLIVAVVGGTNIGKSVVFNHVAGAPVSATSPLASGTKHPVLLVPPSFDDSEELGPLFPGFELSRWKTADEALREDETDRLFWTSCETLPDNLLVLDTPDIDSDARVNWGRADKIRRAADVLIAVLTQQKYNDAAVKQFFRRAAEEDKEVIVLFNQCQLPQDEEYWPIWLETFCSETGVHPELVYIAPNDRAAADENRLSFFLTSGEAETEPQRVPCSLVEELSRLRFQEIKVRTLKGSLEFLLDSEAGIPAWLSEIAGRSDEFRAAAEVLSAHKLAEIHDWPAIPNSLLISEIRAWWSEHREGWSAKVHGFYNALGRGLLWPVRFTRRQLQGEKRPPLDVYRDAEWNAVVKTVERVYQRLEWFYELGNELLQPHLERLLSGTARADLLKEFQRAHRETDLGDKLHHVVDQEMRSFAEDSPKLFKFLRRLDVGAAAVRPATSVVLFVVGAGAVEPAAQVVADSALQSLVHVAGDVAGGTVAATVGETAVSGTASTGMGYIEARFRRLHAVFQAHRAQWLAEMLQEHLIGSFPAELQAAADIPQSEQFTSVRNLLASLATGLDTAACEAPDETSLSTGSPHDAR